ncbi:hypothetical protein T440DRAFT_470612 [Plenodomus tracheiphilus IPT5]|uniref:Galactose oxidase n=1 Tax=Plenodomus tracheiphilus IPT5 TaxID=1408161 RepID=A0A6A7AXK2_9PLEO|nr:hypothetical protein T440DRAFT_470612 [Plenodomus tracheiphilus IPT5]
MHPLHWPRAAWLQWPLLLLLLPLPVTAAQMPYNPTRILRHDTLLYVFQPSPQSSTQFQLRSVDLSSQIRAADIPYTTLHPTLPFLDHDAPRAFTPVLDNGGNLTVYTGNCSQGAMGGQIWSFTPSSSDEFGGGTWLQEEVTFKDSQYGPSMGANYLSGGVAFSSIVGGDATNMGAYIFGGMCPNQVDTSDDWQSAATYSNLMVTLQPSGMGTKAMNYNLDMSPSRGPPIPEAGFSMTGLSPTFSDRSDGTQTQQQNFLLLGGHTSTAFINMSQIALFSLPEQAWTFIGVDQPDTSRADRDIRVDITAVDPRSGHTAVLTPDGLQIIVIGGWVGDVNTPADPQVAILNVAEGYGGRGDWEWVVPATSGNGLPNGSGLYGHGAIMLPDGLLMITGGYSISTPSTRRKRATETSNTKTYFLNITSKAWTTEYVPPADLSPAQPLASGPLSTPGQKAGLGVGLGVGVAAVCGLFAFYMWYIRRLKRQREVREKQLQDLSFTTQRYNIEDYSPGFDGRDSHSTDSYHATGQNGSCYFLPPTQGGHGWRAVNGGDAERTGLLVEIPSPTRGLRRSLSGRPAYAMGRVRGPGQIHPIDELEEEPDEQQMHDEPNRIRKVEMAEKRSWQEAPILAAVPHLDPFTDALKRDGEHRTVLHAVPTSLVAQVPYYVGGPSSDHSVDLVNALQRHSPASDERLSPDKSSSERTSSNLSERSTRSDLSWTSSSAGVMRSTSMRSGAILNIAAYANPFKTPTGSPTQDRPRRNSELDRQSPSDPWTQSPTSVRSNGLEDTSALQSARTSFPHLQAEGEALLGGNPERARPGTSSSYSHTYRDTDGSNSRANTVTPATLYALDMSAGSRPATRERRRSWLGSVRRVLTRSASSAERTRSLTMAASQLEPYRDAPVSPADKVATGARRSYPAADPQPRRAASDASFWRNRRGKQDWLEDEQDPTWRRNAGDDWGAPEDVAMAERERQRQEWRERGNLLVNIDDVDQQLPTPRTPVGPDHLGVQASEDRPCTPASETDWDVEAAVERRVVQVMFTVPKSKLRVVNADIDGSSVLSMPYDSPRDDDDARAETGSPSSRVKDLAGRFEDMSNSRRSPRASPRPSPSPSIKSVKIRAKLSTASLGQHTPRKGSDTVALTKGQ